LSVAVRFTISTETRALLLSNKSYTVNSFPPDMRVAVDWKAGSDEGKIVFSVDYQKKEREKKTNDYCHQNQRILTLM
jgi:hypothetical protein